MQDTKSRLPWNPWPAGIVIFLMIFGGLVFSFAVYAMRQNVDLVTKDYYEDEIQFQKQIDRVGRTASIRGQVAVDYSPDRQSIVIRLPATHKQVVGLVRLYRPSDLEADLKVKLSLDEQGTQTLDIGKLRVGLWKVRVQWTSNGEEYYYDQPVVIESSHPR